MKCTIIRTSGVAKIAIRQTGNLITWISSLSPFHLDFARLFLMSSCINYPKQRIFQLFFFEKINFHCFIWKHKLKQFTELWIIKEKSLKLFQADSLYLLTWPCVFTIIPAWYLQIDSLNVFPFRAIQKELWFIPI